MRGVRTILYIALVLSFFLNSIVFAIQEDTSLVLDDLKITSGPENLEVKLFVTNNEDTVVNSNPVIYIFDANGNLKDKKKLKEYLFLPRKKTTVLVLYEKSFLPDGKYTFQSTITYGTLVGKQSNTVAKSVTVSKGSIIAVEHQQPLPMKLGDGKLFYSLIGSIAIIGAAYFIRQKNHGPVLHSSYGVQQPSGYAYGQRRNILSRMFTRQPAPPSYAAAISHPGMQQPVQPRMMPLQHAIVPRPQVSVAPYPQLHDEIHQEVSRVESQLIHFNKTIEEDKQRIHLLEKTIQTQAKEMHDLQDKIANAKTKHSFFSRMFRTNNRTMEKPKDLIVKPPELEEIMQRAVEEKFQLQQELKAIEQARKEYETQKQKENEAREKKEKDALALLRKEAREREEKRLREEKEKEEKARKEYTHIFDSTHDLIRGKISVLNSFIEEPTVVNNMNDEEIEDIVNKLIGKKPALKHGMQTKSSFLQKLHEITQRHSSQTEEKPSAQVIAVPLKQNGREETAHVLAAPVNSQKYEQTYTESAHVLSAPLKVLEAREEQAKTLSAPMRASEKEEQVSYAYQPAKQGFFARLFSTSAKSAEQYKASTVIRNDVQELTKSLSLKRKDAPADMLIPNEIGGEEIASARISISGDPVPSQTPQKESHVQPKEAEKKQRSWLAQLLRYRHRSKKIVPDSLKQPELHKQPVFGTLQHGSFKLEIRESGKEKDAQKKESAIKRFFSKLARTMQKKHHLPQMEEKAKTFTPPIIKGKEDPHHAQYMADLEEFLQRENRQNTLFNRFIHLFKTAHDPVKSYQAKTEMVFESNETDTPSFVKEDTLQEFFFAPTAPYVPTPTKLNVEGVDEEEEAIKEIRHTPTILQRGWKYLQKRREMHDLQDKLKLVEERAKQLEEEKTRLENEPRLMKENNAVDGTLRLRRHTPVEEISLNILEHAHDAEVKLGVPELEHKEEEGARPTHSLSEDIRKAFKKIFRAKKHVVEEHEEPHIIQAVVTTPHIEEIVTIPEHTAVLADGTIVRKSEIETSIATLPAPPLEWKVDISSPYLEEEIAPEEEISLLGLVRKRLEAGIQKKKHEIAASLTPEPSVIIAPVEHATVLQTPLLKVRESLLPEIYSKSPEIAATVNLSIDEFEPKTENAAPHPFKVNIVTTMKAGEEDEDELDDDLDRYDNTLFANKKKLPVPSPPQPAKPGVLSKVASAIKKRYTFEAEELAHAIEPHQEVKKKKGFFEKMSAYLQKRKVQHRKVIEEKESQKNAKAITLGTPVVVRPLVKQGRGEVADPLIPKHDRSGKPHPFKVDVLSVESEDDHTVDDSDEEIERYDRHFERSHPAEKKLSEPDPFKKSVFTRLLGALKHRSEHGLEHAIERIEPHRTYNKKKEEIHPMGDLASALKKRYVHDVETLAHAIEPKEGFALTQAQTMDAKQGTKLSIQETSPSRTVMKAREMDGKVTVKANDITIPSIVMPKEAEEETVEISAPEQWNVNLLPKKVEDALLKRALVKLNRHKHPIVLKEKKSLFSRSIEPEKEIDPAVEKTFFKENRHDDPDKDLELPAVSGKDEEFELTEEDARAVVEFIDRNKKQTDYQELAPPIYEQQEKPVDPETVKQFMQVNKRPTETKHPQKPMNPIHKAVYAPLTTVEQSKDPIFDEKKRRSLQKIDDALKKLRNT